MALKITNDGWSISRNVGRLRSNDDGFEGHVATPFGYVIVYCYNSSNPPTMDMRFIHDGREHMRFLKGGGGWTRIGAAIIAGKFAKEIAGRV